MKALPLFDANSPNLLEASIARLRRDLLTWDDTGYLTDEECVEYADLIEIAERQRADEEVAAMREP